MPPDDKATRATRKRYDRLAHLYEWSELLLERSTFCRWRALLWSKVEGERILEVGMGTGKNFPYYPPNQEVMAIDFSRNMLRRSKARADREPVRVALGLMDVEHLAFPADTFDTVVASFVFCSVPDPGRGLREVWRVLRPGGKALFLEHVLSPNPRIAWLMNLADPLAVRIIGDHMNRRTVETVKGSGLVVERTTDLSAGIFLLIEARKGRLRDAATPQR